MTADEYAAREKAAIDRAVAGFYATGGWTEERRARFAPIWAEVQRRKAETRPATRAAA